MRRLDDDSPSELAEPADPRTIDPDSGRIGSAVRDAAVDPRPGDFLVPTNAGDANPHGPDVVSPEVHASQGVRPVKPGEVHVDDPGAQDQAETEHAAAATDGTPITDGEVDNAEGDVLKGAALDQALTDAGLVKTGTADEKRARLAEHQAATADQG